jgi:hypothetical protein
MMDALVFGVWFYEVGIILLKYLDISVIYNNITFCMISKTIGYLTENWFLKLRLMGQQRAAKLLPTSI